MTSALYQSVGRALSISRVAKRAFPGIFMGVIGRHSGKDRITLAFKDDPLFRDGSGELNWCALAALANAALGAASDLKSSARAIA